MSDTIVLSVHTTVESKLSDFAVQDGQLVFVRDTQKIALDYGGKRTIYSHIRELATEAARTSLLAPVAGAFYYVVETSVLWTYRGEWIQITVLPSDVVLSSDVDSRINSVIQEKTEQWEFTMVDGSVLTKTVVVLQ